MKKHLLCSFYFSLPVISKISLCGRTFWHGTTAPTTRRLTTNKRSTKRATNNSASTSCKVTYWPIKTRARVSEGHFLAVYYNLPHGKVPPFRTLFHANNDNDVITKILTWWGRDRRVNLPLLCSLGLDTFNLLGDSVDSGSLWDYLLGNQVSNLLYENYFLLFKWAKCALNFPSKLSFLCLSVCWLCFRPCIVRGFFTQMKETNHCRPLACVQMPPLPQKKIGRKSRFSRFFSEEGGTSHRLQASCWGKLQKWETKQQGSGKGQPILPLSFLCPVPCHLLVISYYPP